MMQLTNFEAYTPKDLENPDLNIGYLKSKEGFDWYECQSKFSDLTLKIVFDDDGKILSYAQDISRLWPINASVSEVEMSSVPQGLNLSGKWLFSGGQIVPAPVDYVAEAEREKNKLMASANAAIAPLQDAVDLGMATDAESAQLLEWKKYRVLLNRLDPDKAPEIDWPPVPLGG